MYLQCCCKYILQANCDLRKTFAYIQLCVLSFSDKNAANIKIIRGGAEANDSNIYKSINVIWTFNMLM